MENILSNNSKLRGQVGFTLVEVIVVMVIIGIAATFAIPGFNGFLDSSSVRTAANDFVSACNLARSEAVTRVANVTVCKSANQTTCTTAGDWEQGWIVFVDENGDDDAADTGEMIIRVYDGAGGSTTMAGSANIANRLTYAGSGFFAADFSGTVTVTAGSRSMVIATSATGRVRTQ